MKYIITESQYLLLQESIIPISIKRRANEETLKKYITMGEINYPTLCDDFIHEYEYADNVIDYAIDEFLEEIDDNIYNEDYYSDVMDYLRNLCRDLFGKYLLDIYKETCSEEYDLVNEGISDEFDSTDLRQLEILLNKKIPKYFPWWKEFDLDSIGFSAIHFGTVNLYGFLTVDTDWAYESWDRLHPDIKLTKDIDWALPNFLNDEDYVKIREMIVKYFNALTGESMERITMSNISLHLDDFDSKKMEQNEGELTEKCWKGYTQKGMKTMFGKRYPNCVKKKG